VDTLLLGGKTYEDLSRQEKWPSVKEWPNVTELSLTLGAKINNAHKYVVTRDHPGQDLKWGEYEAPKTISGANIEQQIKDLKNSDGGDIVIFGSPTLVRSLTEVNLIDEYHIQVRPVVVNVGEHLFDNLKSRKDFELIEVTPLKEGTIFVKYRLREEETK
jgi:dihydrofolate reductase